MPFDQQSAEQRVVDFFEVLSCAERTVIAELDAHFRPAPDWYAAMREKMKH